MSKPLGKVKRRNLSANLRFAIAERGYSNDSFAKAAHIDLFSLDRYIAGSDMPQPRIVAELARTLAVPAAALVDSPEKFQLALLTSVVPKRRPVPPVDIQITPLAAAPVRSIPQAILQSTALIAALSEALNFDELKQHNLPPPALRIEPEDREDIRELIAELRQLNKNLEALGKKGAKQSASRSAAAKKSAAKAQTRLDQFLNAFIPRFGYTVGVGSGMLVVSVVATLLYQLGLSETVFDQVIRKVK